MTNVLITGMNGLIGGILKKQLETIDGVGEVRLGGRRDRTIRINLLIDKMSSLNITANYVNGVIKE